MNVDHTTHTVPGVNERRELGLPASPPGVERRQFADARTDLSADAQELAKAVDEYKIQHRRRFVTHEELLMVISSLGYRKG